MGGRKPLSLTDGQFAIRSRSGPPNHDRPQNMGIVNATRDLCTDVRPSWSSPPTRIPESPAAAISRKTQVVGDCRSGEQDDGDASSTRRARRPSATCRSRALGGMRVLAPDLVIGAFGMAASNLAACGVD